MNSKLEKYKADLSELMETKNDPNTPKEIKDAIEPAIKKLNLLITGLGVKNMQSKVSKAPATSKKESKAPSPAKKSSDADLKRCKEILAKYNDKKKTDAKRVEKRKRAGKPAELTPSETIKKAAKSVKTKVVEMDKGLKVSEEASIIRGILDSVVSAMSGIKDSYRKKMFIGKIIEGLKKLEKGVSMKTAEDGMYLHQIHGGELEDSNAEMLRLNLIEIKHHVDEISEAMNNVGDVEGWVVSRSVRAKTDMSDIAHYVDSTSKVRTMADGGMMAKGGKVYFDLFEAQDKIPEKVQDVLDDYVEYGEDITYEQLKSMQRDMERVGYTFDYGLDSIPYGLRPLGVDIEELQEYQENDFADAGYYEDGGMMHSGLLEKVSEDWGKDSDLYSELEEAMVGWSDRNGKLTAKGKIVIKKILIDYDVLEDYDQLLDGGMMAKGGKIEEGDYVFVKPENLNAEVVRVTGQNVVVEFTNRRPEGGEKKGNYKIEDLKKLENGGYMAKRGRLLSALNRDRAYKSSQEWEKHYKRKGRPTQPKYNTSYALGGQAKVKQYPDLSNNKPTVIN